MRQDSMRFGRWALIFGCVGFVAGAACRTQGEGRDARLLEGTAYGETPPAGDAAQAKMYASCANEGGPGYHVAVEPTGRMSVALADNGEASVTYTGSYLEIAVTKAVDGVNYKPGTYYRLAVEHATIKSFVFTQRRVLSADHTTLTTERSLWIERGGAEPERIACKEAAGPIGAGVSN